MRPALILTLAALMLLAAALSGQGTAGAQGTSTIQVGDLWFCGPSFENGVCQTTINAGDAIQWEWVGSLSHTSTECAGDLDACPQPHLWDAGPNSSGSFTFTFDTPGTYVYRCQVHPVEMRGRIVVQAPPTATPTATPTPSPTAASPAPSPTATPAAAPPSGGPPADGPGTALTWWLLLAAGGGLLLAGGAVLALRARRP